MRSRTTEKFRKAFRDLPPDVQRQARKAYQRFKEDPNHPGLRFKRVHSDRPIYSVRISTRYRALGIRQDEVMIWFWIGSHADYDKLLSKR